MGKIKFSDFSKEDIQFNETSEEYSKQIKLLDSSEFPEELGEAIEQINGYLRRVSKSYKDLQNRLDLLENTVNSGVSSLKFDEEGNMISVAWNDGMRRQLGYENKEDFPDNFEAWKNSIPIEMREKMTNLFCDVTKLTSGPNITHSQHPMICKDGTIHWYDAVGKLIRRENGTLKEILASWRDVTAEHDKDIYIEQIETIGKIFDFCYFIRLEDHEFEIIKTNEHIQTVDIHLNDDPFENLKLFTIKTICEEDQEATMAFLDVSTLQDRLRATGMDTLEVYSPFVHDWYRLCFIGGHKDENGNYRDVIYGTSVITADKEKGIMQTQVISALGSEYTTLYIVDTDTKYWTMLETEKSDIAKRTFKKAFEYINYEEALQAYVDNFVVEEDQEYMSEHLRIDSLLAQTPDVGIHSLNYDRIVNGQRQHWQINSAKFLTNEKKEYIVLGFRDVHDIIEKQIEQEMALRDALLAAKHATRAKSIFLSNMSHDIRTPMNAIVGYTALAQTHLDDKEMIQDYLGKIHTSSTHLLSLINEILDMSRIESGTVKLQENVVHIPDVLHDLRTMIQGQIAARQQHLYIDTLDILNEDVITDKLRLNQILLNIVSNAIKYTDNGGNIIIRVTEKPCAVKKYVTYEFRIKDNGKGMAPEFVEHVFDSFSRERTSTVSGIQGTGLGMSITKNIVDLMNGTITVTSELGKGSEFVVTVDFKKAVEKANDVPIPELEGARALVVDDDINT